MKVEAPQEPVQLGDKVTATHQGDLLLRRPGHAGDRPLQGDAHRSHRALVSLRNLGLAVRTGILVVLARLHLVSRLERLGLLAAGSALGVRFGNEPPEVVLDATVPIGPDGTVKIAIDTALAKSLHGNSDHRYDITAEVVDQSRRTIVGSGQVLVARKPFQVFAWTDRGYYQAGDAIRAHVPGADARSEARQRQGSRHARTA